MKNYDYITIDKYLNDELTGKELSLFKEKLKNDKDFADEVKLYQEIDNSLTSRVSNYKQENDLRNTLEDLGKQFKTEDTNLKTKIVKEPKVFRLQRFSKFMVAASIVLVASIFFLNSGKPNYADFADHQNIDLIVRGDSNKHIIDAQDAFNAKDYKTAEKELRSILYLDRTKVELQLYLGICLLEQNEFKKAESILEKIKDGKSIYKNKAIWYLALSKLKQKDYKACKIYLESLPNDAEDFNNSQKLLKKL